MQRKVLLSSATVLILLLGLLYVAPWADGHQTSGLVRISESEMSSLQVELLRSGEITQAAPDVSPQTSSQRQSVDPLASFTLTSSHWGDGKPLSGVKVTLTSVWSDRKYRMQSGEDGVATIDGVVPGKYVVDLAHDFFAPCEPSYGRSGGRSGTVMIPGPEASCKWVEVYAMGWKTMEDDSLVPLHLVRFAPTSEYRGDHEVSDEVYWRLTHKLRSKWGGTVKACLPRPGSSLTRKITLFDEKRGPCEFEIPMLPLSEFHSLTVCDLSQKPVVAPLSTLTIQVVDSADKPIDIGPVGVRRQSSYHGFQSDRLSPNAPHLIPQGQYRISTAHLSYPWEFEDKVVHLESGKGTVVNYRLPYRMREVVLIVDGNGALAHIRKGKQRGAGMTLSDRYRLWLPEGVTKCSFLYVPKKTRQARLVEREIRVAATDTLQHILVTLD